MLNILACDSEFGRTLGQRKHILIASVCTFVLVIQFCLACIIYLRTNNDFLDRQEPQNLDDFVSVTVILFMVVFQILNDIHGKILILLIAKHWLLKVLAYLNYCINIIMLGVVFGHMLVLKGVVGKFTSYLGFICIINIDNAIGAVVVKFWYHDRGDSMFKIEVCSKNYDIAFVWVRRTFIIFNLWAFCYNSYLFMQNRSVNI